MPRVQHSIDFPIKLYGTKDCCAPGLYYENSDVTLNWPPSPSTLWRQHWGIQHAVKDSDSLSMLSLSTPRQGLGLVLVIIEPRAAFQISNTTRMFEFIQNERFKVLASSVLIIVNQQIVVDKYVTLYLSAYISCLKSLWISYCTELLL